MVRIAEYAETDGGSPFATWFDSLDSVAAAKVTVALARISAGNSSNVKGVGKGVLEWKVDFGPGYRIYFGKDGDRLILLLGGGTKRHQQQDIDTAIRRWQDFRNRKG